MKSKIAYIIGLSCGVLTLTVGTGIFLIWWAARDWFAISLIDLEVYGFFWIMIATPIALIGLFLMLFALGNNYPKFLKRTTLALLLILSNIPAVYLILEKHSDLSQQACFKLTNHSKLDNHELTISASTFEQELGKLTLDESVVSNFYPKYLSNPRTSVPLVDSVRVTILTSEQEYQTVLPTMYKGSCSRLVLTEDFEVKWE